MKILIVDNANIAAQKASNILTKTILDKPKAVLGLATGGTMLNVYKELVKAYKLGGFSFSDISSFNLDEYIGLPPEDACSYRSYMNQELFSQIDIKLENTNLPDGMSENLGKEAEAYENKINKMGGLDLILLGLGGNGHIGFNEPSSSLGSYTRIKKLSRDTCAANEQYFENSSDMPTHALTMGVQTILNAKHCVLVATGEGKSSAVKAMIEGPLSSSCPASALQMHRNATIIIDRQAASKLANIEDYLFIHPNGNDG